MTPLINECVVHGNDTADPCMVGGVTDTVDQTITRYFKYLRTQLSYRMNIFKTNLLADEMTNDNADL
jgi:hypothetical protein